MPTKKSAYHHADLRTVLLREAERVLRERGPEGLSLREIARAVGVSEAAPYHHFRDRTALIGAIAAGGFQKLGVAFAAHDGAEPRERLAGLGGAYVRFAIDEPGAFRAMFGAHVVELELPRLPEVYGPGHNARELLMRVCGDVAVGTDVTPAQLFALTWGLVHGIAWLHVQREFPDCVADDDAAVALATAGVRHLLDGLAPAGLTLR